MYRCAGLAEFAPVGKDCLVLGAARSLRVPPMAVVLGASYCQRLACMRQEPPSVYDEMGYTLAVAAAPENMNRLHVDGTFQVTDNKGIITWTVQLYLACLHIAVKLLHQPHSTDMEASGYSLKSLTARLCRYRISNLQIMHMERWILQRLNYRVSPATCPTLGCPANCPARAYGALLEPSQPKDAKDANPRKRQRL